MSSIEITNGATVSRAHGDSGATELLAVFQYGGDATAFAEAKVAEDIKQKWSGSFYVVADLYSGTVVIVKAKP